MNKPARIIAVANQKGGAGKTTTAQAIAAGAQKRGKKTLAIDFDPQGSLTFSMGADGAKKSVYDLLTGEKAQNTIQHAAQCDIIPGSLNLATLDTDLSKKTGSNLRLKAALQPLTALYDIIVIDCPPALGIGFINALTAATEVLIPAQADIYSLQGLYLLTDTIKQVKAANNPELTCTGVFLTRYSPRSIITQDLTAAFKKKCEALSLPFLDTPIREGVSIKEAQTMRQSLFDYAPKSKQAADYNALLDILKI